MVNEQPAPLLSAHLFAQWWPLVQPRVLAAVRRLLSEHDAEDLAQDVAIIAAGSAPPLDSPDQLAVWCVVRARWLAIDRLRLIKRRRGLLDRFRRSRTRTAEAPADAPSEGSELFELLDRLPLAQRTVLVRSLYGDSDTAIAAAMGIQPASVRSLRRHARVRLLQLLATDDRKGSPED